EDGLEGVQAHALVEVLILGNLLVFGEQVEPVGLRERWHDADEGTPFGDREARPGQPRRTPNAHHQEDQHRHPEQPCPQTCALVRNGWGDPECRELRHGTDNAALSRASPCGAWATGAGRFITSPARRGLSRAVPHLRARTGDRSPTPSHNPAFFSRPWWRRAAPRFPLLPSLH